jgi:hypothetical protein
MKSLFWLIVGAVAMAAIAEANQRASSQPLIPDIQPGGCVPGDPSFTIHNKTYCLPQGVIPF